MQVKDPIYVKSEWADLKECVYGSPDGKLIKKRLREFWGYWKVQEIQKQLCKNGHNL